MSGVSTSELYDTAAARWQRSEPVLLSDFTARPFLLDWCEPVRGADVLDLGCGEGYVARQLAERGAASVRGVDISSEMIERARRAEAAEPAGIDYAVGDASDLGRFGAGSFDLVVAVFLFNYVSVDAMRRTIAEVARLLRPGGRFVFSVPHPSLAFVRPELPPFYFRSAGTGYFSGRDRQMEGEIWRRDGASVPVRCVHKTLADYFTALADAGFARLPDVAELGVTDEHIRFDEAFFAPLRDTPLHLAFRVPR